MVLFVCLYRILNCKIKKIKKQQQHTQWRMNIIIMHNNDNKINTKNSKKGIFEEK